MPRALCQARRSGVRSIGRFSFEESSNGTEDGGEPRSIVGGSAKRARRLGSPTSRSTGAPQPTPLEFLPRLSAALGGPRIFVKRDDCTGLIAWIRAGRWHAGKDIVFLHTGGSPALFAYRDFLNTVGRAAS